MKNFTSCPYAFLASEIQSSFSSASLKHKPPVIAQVCRRESTNPVFSSTYTTDFMCSWYLQFLQPGEVYSMNRFASWLSTASLNCNCLSLVPLPLFQVLSYFQNGVIIALPPSLRIYEFLKIIPLVSSGSNKEMYMYIQSAMLNHCFSSVKHCLLFSPTTIWSPTSLVLLPSFLHWLLPVCSIFKCGGPWNLLLDIYSSLHSFCR